MKTKLLGWTVLFLLVLLIIPLFGQAQETNHVADKFNPDVLRAQAVMGNAQAQYNLGNCYANGQGVAKDEAEAMKWYRRAAEQGFLQAQLDLAMGLGENGDPTEGIKWLREAAQNGVADAQCELGMAYLGYTSLWNKVVPIDAVEAVKWLSKAAEQGDAEAQGNLGECYFRGQGTVLDYIQAYKWVNLAAGAS